MGALLVLLLVTNLASLGVIGWLLLRSPAGEPDAVVTAAIERTTRPAGALGVRRVITIEMLNPVQVASSRGKVAGLAGSLAPALVKRVVIDQTVRQIKRDMQANDVIADVRLHTIRPAPAAPATLPGKAVSAPTAAPAAPPDVLQPAAGGPVYYDEIRRLDLDDVEDPRYRAG